MADVDALPGPLRIGAFAARVGVRPERLRAWERRYGLLRPERGPGGFRLYGSDDAERVARMQDALAGGVPAAEAARRIVGQADPAPAAPEHPASDPAARPSPDTLLAAISELDEAAVQGIIDDALATWGLEATVQGLLFPALRALGEGWQRGDFDISHEHFASNLIRARLLGLARFWGRGAGPLALLACLPGERHELGLIAFGLLLRSQGWRILYLGVDTPLATVARTAHDADAAAVVLATFDPRRARRRLGELRRLGEERRLVLSGPGAVPGLVADAGALALPADVSEASAALAGLSATPRGTPAARG